MADGDGLATTPRALPVGAGSLTDIFDGTRPPPPMWRLLGMGIDELTDTSVTLGVTPVDAHANEAGIAHGALVAAMIDSATGSMLRTRVPVGARAATVDLNISFVRAVTRGTGRLRCTATVVHSGRRIAVVTADVTDLDGRVYATGRATYSIAPPRSDQVN